MKSFSLIIIASFFLIACNNSGQDSTATAPVATPQPPPPLVTPQAECRPGQPRGLQMGLQGNRVVYRVQPGHPGPGHEHDHGCDLNPHR